MPTCAALTYVVVQREQKVPSSLNIMHSTYNIKINMQYIQINLSIQHKLYQTQGATKLTRHTTRVGILILATLL